MPEGESAFGLVSEAIGLLGSPDTAWRDDVGYGVVATCVYQKKRLGPEERRALVARLCANLLRSFHFLLLAPGAPGPAAAEAAAREKVLATLAAIRR